MRRRIWYMSLLLSVMLVAGCGKKEAAAPKEAEALVEEEAKEPPAPGEETWGTAPEYKATLITTTPVRYLAVTVGQTEEEVNLTWYSPAEEAGQVYWTTAEDTEFANAVTFEANVYPSDITSGYYVNRATVTGLLPKTE